MRNNITDEINELLDGTVKLVTSKYIVYDREWLEENIDEEVELIKDHKEKREKGIEPFNKNTFDEYVKSLTRDDDKRLYSMFNKFKQKGGCIGCKEKNCNGFSRSCFKFVDYLDNEYSKIFNKAKQNSIWCRGCPNQCDRVTEAMKCDKFIIMLNDEVIDHESRMD